MGQRLALGLDMGTNTGFAYTFYDPDQPIHWPMQPVYLGQWDLSAGPYDTGALRFVRFRHFLNILKPDIIFAEDVKYTPAEAVNYFNAAAILARAATSMEFFGAMKGTLAAWCEARQVPLGLIPIGTIKRRATGKGNANKEQVIAAANDLLGLGLVPEDYKTTGVDNVADSVFCLICGLDDYGDGVDPVPKARKRQKPKNA